MEPAIPFLDRISKYIIICLAISFIISVLLFYGLASQSVYLYKDLLNPMALLDATVLIVAGVLSLANLFSSNKTKAIIILVIYLLVLTGGFFTYKSYIDNGMILSFI